MPSIYLFRRNGRYYFRIRIPLDLQRWFSGRREFKRSLRTESHAFAKSSAKNWAYRTDRLFAMVRSGMLTDDQIKKLVADYLTHALQETEEDRIDKFGCPSDPEAHAEMVDIYSLVLTDQREDLALGNCKGVTHVADLILEGAGIELPKDSFEYQKLCRELLKGSIAAGEIELERMRGNYGNEYDRRSRYFPAPSHADTQAVAIAKPVEMLSKLLEDYVHEHAGGGHWKDKTKAENESIYELFLGIMGDRDVKTLTHRDLVDFREALKRFPTNWKKKVAYREKAIPEIPQMEVADPLSVTTVNKYLTRVGGFLKWATKNGYIEQNYAEGLSISKKSTRESEEREAYSTEDLQRLLASPPYHHTPKAEASYHKHSERYWIPLIGLFSGMRLNEICQLHVEDIRDVDGIPSIDINGEGTKKIKTASSKRIIPIHPELIRLGLMKYVSRLRAEGVPRLWMNLKLKRDGYGHDFGKWFRRLNRKRITKNPKRVFHSFRHTLVNNLKQKRVEESVLMEIAGHSQDSITLERYGKRYEPKTLLEVLEKLSYGIEEDLQGIPIYH